MEPTYTVGMPAHRAARPSLAVGNGGAILRGTPTLAAAARTASLVPEMERRSGGSRVALGGIRMLEDLIDAALEAEVDQLHHQVIVGDAEPPEAAQPGAGVHQEAEQDPALGIEDLAFVELRGVGLVDGLHDLLAHAGE